MRLDRSEPVRPGVEWRRYLFTCAGHDDHFLYVEWWDNDPHDDWEGIVGVIPVAYCWTLWRRITTAARILAGRQSQTSPDVILDRETVTRLQETLAEYQAQEEAKEERS